MKRLTNNNESLLTMLAITCTAIQTLVSDPAFGGFLPFNPVLKVTFLVFSFRISEKLTNYAVFDALHSLFKYTKDLSWNDIIFYRVNLFLTILFITTRLQSITGSITSKIV